MYLGTACPPGTADLIALLTGVDLSWSQEKVRWYHMGSLNHYYVLDGVIAFDGGFRKAYTDNRYIGTLQLYGTYIYCGSIVPRGGNSPAILGTVKMTGGSLSNMEQANANAVGEENTFIMYNLTFVG
jgi:hypothetical protein